MNLLEMTIWEHIEQIAVALITAMIPVFVGYITVRFKLNQDDAEMTKAIAHGVLYSRQRYVDKKKALLADDGVFSEADQAEARRFALEGALEVARPAIEAKLRALTPTQMDVRIEAAVAASKGL